MNNVHSHIEKMVFTAGGGEDVIGHGEGKNRFYFQWDRNIMLIWAISTFGDCNLRTRKEYLCWNQPKPNSFYQLNTNIIHI